MKRDGNNHLGLTALQEFSASTRHQASERFAEGDLAAIFEFLHSLTQWMFFRLFTRITSPRPSLYELRRPRQARATGMIVTAGVGKGPAADVAHRMAHEPDFVPASGAKILRVVARKRLSARAAARRIEPIDEPVKTFRNRWPRGKFHRVGEFSKIGMIVEPNSSAARIYAGLEQYTY